MPGYIPSVDCHSTYNGVNSASIRGSTVAWLLKSCQGMVHYWFVAPRMRGVLGGHSGWKRENPDASLKDGTADHPINSAPYVSIIMLDQNNWWSFKAVDIDREIYTQTILILKKMVFFAWTSGIFYTCIPWEIPPWVTKIKDGIWTIAHLLLPWPNKSQLITS